MNTAPAVRRERLSSFEDLRGGWSTLAQRAGSVFATPEWAETWWRHFGHGHELRLVACFEGERLAAILPLCRSARAPRGFLRFVGYGPADELGPVCAPDDRPLAAQTLIQELHGSRGILLAGQMHAASGWAGLTGARVAVREGNPVLRFGASRTWEELSATWTPSVSRKFRQNTRRLAREFEVGWHLTRSPGALAPDLDALFTLHAARWGEGTTAFGGRHRDFHRDFARIALERGWLQLSRLELDGAPAAAVYNLRYADADHQYQQGRDPRFDNRSVGFVALAASIRRALEDGLREFRFGRGNEAYKYLFATDDPGLETLVLGSGRLTSGVVRLGLAVPDGGLRALKRRLA